MGDEVYTISGDDYDSWLTPAQALTLLSDRGTRDDVIAAILNRAGLGLIRGAAEMGEVDTDDTKGRERYLLVPETYWRLGSTFEHQKEFWRTGDVTFYVSKLTSDFSSSKFIAFTGIRFERSGVVALGRQLSGEVPELPPQAETDDASDGAPLIARKGNSGRGMPRLSDALLREWLALFRIAHPHGSKQLAEKSVAGMFPDHEIGRSRVRDFFPDAKMGRPLNKKEK